MEEIKIMKKLKKIAIYSCAFALGLSMTACGKKESDKKDTTEITETEEETEDVTEEEVSGKEETVTWGFYTITVPAGCTFEGGGFMDENDTRYFKIKKSDFTYFDFKAEDSEDNMMGAYNYNKDTYTNEQKDVSGTFGDIKWTGFQYGDGFGGNGFELYATINGKYIRISSAGYAFDDPMVEKVLGSLIISDGSSSDDISDEASATDVNEDEANAVTEEAINYIQVNEMKGARVGIPEGYSVIKESTSQVVSKNDETGYKVSFWTGSDNATEAIRKSIGEGGYDTEEWDIDGIHWLGYIPYDGAYVIATDTSEGHFLIDMEYGSMEELEMIIRGVELAE